MHGHRLSVVDELTQDRLLLPYGERGKTNYEPFMINGTIDSSFGIAIGSDELEAKTIRIMQMARSAMFYVSFAIGIEERKKQVANPDRFIVSMPLYDLDDKRKRRDPC